MTQDLPVAVALPAPLDTEVTAWVERDLGWQVVDPGGPLAPVIALSDHPCEHLPWIAVSDGLPDGEQVRRHLTAGALDVVGWPHDRLRIPLLAAQAERGRGISDHSAGLIVAGAAGGVGTSTVALAIGGLLAWSGADVLVSGPPDLVELAGATPPRHAARVTSYPVSVMPVAVPGITGLSVVGDGNDVATAAWTGDVVVVDRGTVVGVDTTVVVSRPDRNLVRARAAGVPVVVIGERPLSGRACRGILSSSLLAQLPMSARVARAGLLGRIPTALPGGWLRTLRVGLARLESRS